MPQPRHGDAAAAVALGDEARLWYGRMYLPPADALLPPHGVPYAEHRAGEIERGLTTSAVPADGRASRRFLADKVRRALPICAAARASRA
eukprot:1743384-Prymnesium_polylepis.1